VPDFSEDECKTSGGLSKSLIIPPILAISVPAKSMDGRITGEELICRNLQDRPPMTPTFFVGVIGRDV